MIIYALKDYERLASEVIEKTSAQKGEWTSKIFPNRERYLRITTNPRHRDAVLIGGTVNDSATLDLFDLASGLVMDGCRSLRLVIPFFSYSTMERATKAGEVVMAKTRARLLSAVPAAPFGNQVLLLDLHSEGIPFYFEGALRAQHLYAKHLVTAAARRLGGENFVLGAVDAGRAKWVESLANELGVPAGFIYKKRTSEGGVVLSGANVAVKDKTVVIYDDMIRSGSSILLAAQAYRDAGAREISVITTHADFADGAIQKMANSGLIKKVVCTDSHPRARQENTTFIEVLSTAEVFAHALLDGWSEHA